MYFKLKTIWPLVTLLKVTATFLLGMWFTLGRPLEIPFKWVKHTPLDKTCHTWNLSKSNSKWLLWPWKWSQGQMHGMSWKPMTREIIWCINSRPICKTFWITAFSILHWFTLDRWTLAYKSEVKGHSDLILWLQGATDLRCSHARLEGSRFIGVKTCHQSVYGRTDERTNGRRIRLSLKLCDLWSAKLKTESESGF